jgi:hypothetical protein
MFGFTSFVAAHIANIYNESAKISRGFVSFGEGMYTMDNSGIDYSIA